MNEQDFKQRFKNTSFRNISRYLRVLRKEHPYNNDVITQAIEIIDWLGDLKAGKTHDPPSERPVKKEPPYLTVGGKTFPLLEKRDAPLLLLKPENGFYIDSEHFQGVQYFINRQHDFIVIYDKRCGILEIDFNCMSQFIDELLEMEDMYVTA